MKILFVMRSTLYVRNFESTLRMLAERGHEVRIVTQPHPEFDPANHAGRLAAECPGIVHDLPPTGPPDGWALLSEDLRRSVSYLRYLRPEYRAAPKVRRRARSYAQPFILKATTHRLARSAVGLASMSRALRLLDDALPVNPAVFEFVREQNPDLVMVTPLMVEPLSGPGTPQSQYLRAARALGIRTALCVHSWDNLTNKGLIQDPLDLVTVWNEPMRREAVELHHVPGDRVAVTGAPSYDHWFEWKPRWTRDQFCRRVGLPAERPYLLYLCSSKFIAPHEVPFIRRWIEQTRAASPILATTSVLIRPHPQWAIPWRTTNFSDLDAVSIWPAAGANPVDADSRAEYYDSIFHSAGVVGVNTSAQIESAVVGRGVYTWLTAEFRETQEGTLHFHHLRQVNGGALHVAESLADHVAQLEGAVSSGGVDDGRCRRFVEVFVRPGGIDVAATPRLVAAIEGVMARPAPRPQETPWYARWVRARLERFTGPLVRKREGRARLTQQQEENRAQRLAESEERDTRRAAKVIEDLRVRQVDLQISQQVVDIYDDVRARVRRMRAAAGVSTDVPGLAPLWNATPEMLVQLRHYGTCVGAANYADYVDVPDPAKRQFRSHLRRLRQEAGDDLRVCEAPVLGQFGIARGNGVYTADTLTYYEILAALKFGAVLGLFDAPARRPVVWEASRDWGGFAYQFKTLFPDVTHVVSSHPDLFLLSASYLRTLFPQARVRFYGDTADGDLWRDLSTVDFVFLPDNLPPAVHPPYVDVALDLMGLEHMAHGQAEQHVRSVFDLGTAFFYSAMPLSAGERLAAVRAALARYYWLYELPVPQFDRREALQPWSPRDVPDHGRIKRAHIMGWKRLCL